MNVDGPGCFSLLAAGFRSSCHHLTAYRPREHWPSSHAAADQAHILANMRARSVLALLATIFLTALLLLRHHLRDLGEVARTYSTFYPFLSRHPETLYRYPQPAGASPPETGDGELAPQIIHQIFLTEGRPSKLAKYEPAIESCRSMHANWTHNLWTDERANAFMAEYYPDIFPHYRSYKQSIQRANILRYALLDHFGGVYLDVDVTCLEPLDNLRHIPFITPGAYPAGVNNAFILTRPHHGFLRHLLAGVPSRDLLWGMPYIENMLSTGCMFFSNRWMSYVRSLTPSHGTAGDQVHILADPTGDMDPHMLRGAVTTPLFRHGGASSWHGWDAAAIVLIGKHYVYFLCMVALGAACASLAVWRLTRRARARRGRSPLRRSMDKSAHDEEGMVGVKEG